MKRTAALCVLMMSAGILVKAQTEIFNPMKNAIKGNDAAALVKTFAPSLDLNLEGNTSTYSKVQSEFVLKDFFKKHPVNDFSIVHTGSSKGGLQFAIGRYVSGADSYSVLIRVRQVGEEYLVHEISFVKE